MSILTRVFWMFLGPFMIFLIGILILKRPNAELTALDAVFLGVVVLLVAVRYADVRWLKGKTATGEPTTLRHWLRHAVIVLLVSLLGWALIHALGGHVAW